MSNEENYLQFQQWKDKVIYKKDTVTLPDGRTLSKDYWVTKLGFDTNAFNSFLYDLYNKIKKD